MAGDEGGQGEGGITEVSEEGPGSEGGPEAWTLATAFEPPIARVRLPHSSGRGTHARAQRAKRVRATARSRLPPALQRALCRLARLRLDDTSPTATRRRGTRARGRRALVATATLSPRGRCARGGAGDDLR